tara:strand:- start:584 stop:1378 length:795 start_codon:yes stop_codon:yes gene_type:complete
MKKNIFGILLFLISLNLLADTVVIQSTTSTRDSGLYQYLLPHYPNYKDVQIKVIAVGTGQAIMNAKNCDGNILIVHDEKRELDFIQKGYGVERHNLMYNDFIVVGPVSDPSKIQSKSTIQDVFSSIYYNNNIFVSRSDSSGTHSAEMSVWERTKLNPKKYSGIWYLESGQGMGPSLNIAISLNGYIFSDRSSWLRFSNKRNHRILYENSSELRNNYGMILVNHDRCSNLKYGASKKLYDWLSSDAAAILISNYSINKSKLFYID